MVRGFSYFQAKTIFVNRICVSIMMGSIMCVMGRGLVVISNLFSIIGEVGHYVRVSNCCLWGESFVFLLLYYYVVELIKYFY